MPTALELTREEWQRYIDAARQQPLPPKPGEVERRKREQLLERVREAAAQLKTRYGVRQVVLFGSLADSDWFAADSDVDLAVAGLQATDFWQAWRLVEEIIALKSDGILSLIITNPYAETYALALRQLNLQQALADLGKTTHFYEQLEALELALSDKYPFYLLARFYHLIACKDGRFNS